MAVRLQDCERRAADIELRIDRCGCDPGSALGPGPYVLVLDGGENNSYHAHGCCMDVEMLEEALTQIEAEPEIREMFDLAREGDGV